MEEGKIATAWAQFAHWKKSINVYKKVYLGVTRLLAWGRLDQFQPFGEPASRFTSAIERSGIWKKVR
jgi:hypothetical protein